MLSFKIRNYRLKTVYTSHTSDVFEYFIRSLSINVKFYTDIDLSQS